jgi:diphthine-ammonia ligase
LFSQCLDELDSYMYQSVGHEIIDLFAQAMELPLYRAEIKGNARTIDKDYAEATLGDEVEDLYELLVHIQVNLSLKRNSYHIC